MLERERIISPLMFLIFLGMVCLTPFSPSLYDQAFGNGGEDGIIERMRGAAPHERGRKAFTLAEEGEEVVTELAELIEEYRYDEDKQLVASLILAVGHIGPEAREATGVLLGVLESPFTEVSYTAARSLGRIWEQEGDGETDTIREVNTALLSHSVEKYGAGKYGPALALVRINDIQTDQSPQAPSPEDLSNSVFSWFMEERQNRLMDRQEWPWPLLAKTYLESPGSEGGESAHEMLVGISPPDASCWLLRQLERAEVDTERWELLSDLLEDITGVGFPQPENSSADDVKEAVHEWRLSWYEDLKARKDDQHREYVWQLFERAVLAAKFNAYREDLEHFDTLQGVILNQYDSPGQIPDWASESAREVMAPPLRNKSEFIEALDTLAETDVSLSRREGAMARLWDVRRGRMGDETGWMFLDEIVAIARTEEASQIRSELSRFLSALTGHSIPLDEDPEVREQMLEEWVEGVETDDSNPMR